MILAGYQLNVTSYEGDANHYNTKTMHGLSLAEVKFHIALVQVFASYGRKGMGLGNECPSNEEYIKVILPILKAHPCAAEYLEEKDSYAVENAVECIVMEYIGYSYESNYNRAYDGHTVYFFENDVPEVDL